MASIQPPGARRDARVTPADRILIVLPNWVGDVVLATPTLAALRTHFATRRITFLGRGYVRDIVDGGGWHDEWVEWPAGRGLSRERATLRLASQLKSEHFDVALLLPNSFRAALLAWLARIPRRVGYARDGRSLLLTDRLRPLRRHGEFLPTPMLPYYAAIAQRVGCPVVNDRLRLGVTPEQEQAGAAFMAHHRLERGEPFAIINAGAAFGASKCWPPDRFARVCDRLRSEHGMRSVLIGGPSEAPLLRRIASLVLGEVVCADNPGTTLGSLKVLVRECTVLIGNDTGPRHYGEAFGRPLVTIFGPTHKAWVWTDYDADRRLQADVPCGPCQLPVCPLDHRCMRGVSVDDVMAAVADVIRGRVRRLPLTTVAASARTGGAVASCGGGA